MITGEETMQTTTYGKEDAKTVLIQMVDDHDLEEIESERWLRYKDRWAMIFI